MPIADSENTIQHPDSTLRCTVNGACMFGPSMQIGNVRNAYDVQSLPAIE